MAYSAAPVSFFPIFLSDAGNVVESFRFLNRSNTVESETFTQTGSQDDSVAFKNTLIFINML